MECRWSGWNGVKYCAFKNKQGRLKPQQLLQPPAFFEEVSFRAAHNFGKQYRRFIRFALRHIY